MRGWLLVQIDATTTVVVVSREGSGNKAVVDERFLSSGEMDEEVGKVNLSQCVPREQMRAR